MPKVTDIITKGDFDAVLASNKLVAVDFSAAWCGPCKMISPKFEEFSDQYSTIKFVKVDVDEGDEIAQACGISAMPTFFFYKDGQKVAEFKGASEADLKANLDKLAA